MTHHAPLVPALSAAALLLVTAGGVPATAQEPPRPDPPAPPDAAPAARPAAPAATAPPPDAPTVRGPAGLRPAPPSPPPPDGYLGVVLEEVEAGDVERLGLEEERGALVRDVADGSPADSAGLRAGDVVVSWRGEQVFSAAQLGRLVRETPAGREVRVEVIRDGDRAELTVVPREREGANGYFGRRMPPEARAEIRERLRGARERWRDARGDLDGLDERLGELGEHMEEAWREAGDSLDVHRFRFSPGAGDGRTRLGVVLRSLTPQLADYFGLGERSGALVASVRDESHADSAGVRAGDVLLSIDGREISSPADAAAAVARASGDVGVRILRRGEERTLTARLAGPEEPVER